MKKKHLYHAGLPVAGIAATALPEGYDTDVMYLRRTILDSRMALVANDLLRKRMLRAAIRGLVEDAMEDVTANLTDRLFELVTEPEDDDTETGELSDDDLASLH